MWWIGCHALKAFFTSHSSIKFYLYNANSEQNLTYCTFHIETIHFLMLFTQTHNSYHEQTQISIKRDNCNNSNESNNLQLIFKLVKISAEEAAVVEIAHESKLKLKREVYFCFLSRQICWRCLLKGAQLQFQLYVYILNKTDLFYWIYTHTGYQFINILFRMSIQMESIVVLTLRITLLSLK